jgi:hypothetical protein
VYEIELLPVFLGNSKVPPVCGTLGFELQVAIDYLLFIIIF